MTTVIKKRYLPSHIILGDRFGLKEPSMVMLEQLRTVNQADLLEYIGRIDDEHCMKKINIGVKKALGLWVDKPYRQACRYALPVREMLGELQEQPELHRKAA